MKIFVHLILRYLITQIFNLRAKINFANMLKIFGVLTIQLGSRMVIIIHLSLGSTKPLAFNEIRIFFFFDRNFLIILVTSPKVFFIGVVPKYSSNERPCPVESQGVGFQVHGSEYGSFRFFWQMGWVWVFSYYSSNIPDTVLVIIKYTQLLGPLCRLKK